MERIFFQFLTLEHVPSSVTSVRLGREVTTLVSENKLAGVHEVQFDASGLPSGVYLCRMTADSFVELRKLLLLR